MPTKPGWNGYNPNPTAEQSTSESLLFEFLQRLLKERQEGKSYSPEQIGSMSNAIDKAAPRSQQAVNGFTDLDNPWEQLLAMAQPGDERNQVIGLLLDQQELSGDKNYASSRVNDPILSVLTQAFSKLPKGQDVQASGGFFDWAKDGAAKVAPEPEQPNWLQGLLSTIMSGAGGNGMVSRNVALPRMSGPSDEEIQGMVSSLVTQASAPYDAAQTNLDASKAGGLVEIAKAANDAKAATEANNAKFSQESAAAQQATAARNAQAQQDSAATTARLGQMLAAFGGQASAAQGYGQAASQSVQNLGNLQQNYMDNARQLGEQSGRDAMNTASRIGESGQANLLNLYGQMLSSLQGKKASAVGEATARGQQWGQERRDRANEFNLSAAQREAELNAPQYQQSADPLAQMERRLGLAAKVQELTGAQADDLEWDFSQLSDPARKFALRGQDLPTTLGVLDNYRQYHKENGGQDNDDYMRQLDQVEEELYQRSRRYGGRAGRAVASAFGSGAR